MLSICTLVFSIAIILMGTVKEYWHLVVLRMILAAGYVYKLSLSIQVIFKKKNSKYF